MDDTVKLTGSNIALMIGIFIAVIIITLLIGKMLKKCCVYAFVNGIKIFSLLNVGVFAIPFALTGAMVCCRFEFIIIQIVVISFIVCLSIPIIINICRMGFLYGFAISCFRLIAACFGFMFAFGVIAMFALVIMICFAVAEAIYERTVTVITHNGEVLNLARTSGGLLVDVDTGNTYYSYGQNMLHCNDTGENLYF